MRKPLLAVAVAGCLLASGALQAQDIESNLNASMRLGLELDTEPDAELNFNNFGSRIRWNGSAGLQDGLRGIGYIELGFDQDNGVDRTRQAWLGVEADFGTVRGGKQYTAFYDAVTSVVDIAYWNSCFLEISCARQSSVIKYTGNEAEEGELQFMVSTTLVENDPGMDFIDGIEVAAVMDRDDIRWGVGANLLLGNGLEDDAGGTLELDTGFGLGVSAQMPVGEATASATVQYANSDFLATQDNGIILTATYGKGNMYGLFSIGNADNTPFYLTYGYVYDVVPDRALIYFEACLEEADIDGQDANLFGRAVMIFDFDVLSTGG